MTTNTGLFPPIEDNKLYETFKNKEDATFVRCIDFMVKMIEKYGSSVVE